MKSPKEGFPAEVTDEWGIEGAQDVDRWGQEAEQNDKWTQAGTLGLELKASLMPWIYSKAMETVLTRFRSQLCHLPAV